jgi:hypothetical protein
VTFSSHAAELLLWPPIPTLVSASVNAGTEGGNTGPEPRLRTGPQQTGIGRVGDHVFFVQSLSENMTPWPSPAWGQRRDCVKLGRRMGPGLYLLSFFFEGTVLGFKLRNPMPSFLLSFFRWH